MIYKIVKLFYKRKIVILLNIILSIFFLKISYVKWSHKYNIIFIQQILKEQLLLMLGFWYIKQQYITQENMGKCEIRCMIIYVVDPNLTMFMSKYKWILLGNVRITTTLY